MYISNIKSEISDTPATKSELERAMSYSTSHVYDDSAPTDNSESIVNDFIQVKANDALLGD